MKLAYISTYPPRECGLATFNSNLLQAINKNLFGQILDNSLVVALNHLDDKEEFKYPDEVKYVIRENVQADYAEAAKFINQSDVDACIMQHEFGIYGGENGIFVLPFIYAIEKPVIAIFHTVLDNPSFMQREIIKQIANKCAKVVVMSKKAVGFLRDIYGLAEEKVQVIEHGVPDLEPPIVNPVNQLPQLFGKKLLLTFGLISRNKGLETVVKALPAIVKQHPDVAYVVLGNTHPGILKHSGEEYRDYLKTLAKDLGVDNHLIFLNQFVAEEELVNYLSAATIYVTPYLNEAQITSGTLSYAVGAGAAVVSTPYWHAQELLANGRGMLFDFKDDKALASAVNNLLDNPSRLAALKQNAYTYGLKIRWPKIGDQFLQLAHNAVKHQDYSDLILRQIIDLSVMPKFDMSYIRLLTDDTGIFQHAKYGVPNRKEGYCLDDNSRALIMALMALQNGYDDVKSLMPIYLSYIHDLQLDNGNFRNFLSFDRKYLDEEGSDDSFGRTVWALGYLINSSISQSYNEFGHELFHKAVPHMDRLTHLRGICNTIIGISLYLKKHPGDGYLVSLIDRLAGKLIHAYKITKSDDWHWFENHMTYDNAIFPLALFHAVEITGNNHFKDVAFESLAYLEKLTFNLKVINPVGNRGWLFRDQLEIPLYDQQAIEIMAMVLMYQQIYTITGNNEYLQKMFTSYMWFLGENSLRIPLYDVETKGCADGLQPGGVNRNQGAESTLAYWISHLAIEQTARHDKELASSTVLRSRRVKTA